MTAGELLKQREHDPEYRAQMQELEKKSIAAAEEFKDAVAPLMAELLSSGYDVRSLDVLAQSNAYKNALPILVKWLPKVTNPRVKESIVRTLSVPWAGADAVESLVSEFSNTPDTENKGLKWAIGNALEVLASTDIFDEIVELVQDKRHGIARQMLAVGLGKMKNPRAVSLLIKLLDDEELAGHAIIGLRKLGAKEVLPYIERFVNHPKPWIRQEAKKAITKINQS